MFPSRLSSLLWCLALTWFGCSFVCAELLTPDPSQSINRRQAFSEKPVERLEARVGLAFGHLKAAQLPQALAWVEEYAEPLPENLRWPVVKGYLTAAKVKAAMGQTFDALHRLNRVVDKGEGLGKVAALHTLSELLQEKPDMKGALTMERRALATGNSHFERKRISETAGLEPPKEGHETWKEWKPIIEARIKELEELADIEAFGLDFVLYRKAQRLRRADHPRALDFVSIGKAFGLQAEGAGLPDTDFAGARELYADIIKRFPKGVYSDAAKLYSAVCLVHLDEPEKAIKEWMAFYRENPDGLYRGEALKLIGDTYLTNLWDPRNAREAYERAVAWIESVSERNRILDTYVVPEKSAAISRPPKTSPREFDELGNIQRETLGAGILFNRATATWYLDDLRVELEWRLGFLDYLDGKKEEAARHYDLALKHDVMVQRAISNSYYNSHMRMMQSLKQTALLDTAEELRGITGKRRLAIEWADLMYLLANFEDASSLYRRLQVVGDITKDEAVIVRATLAEMHLMYAMNIPDRMKEVPRLYSIYQKYPKAPATPALLLKIALLAPIPGDPIDARKVMQQLIDEYPRSYLIPEARYLMIFRFESGEPEIRRKMTEQYIRDFPNEKGYIDLLHKTNKLKDGEFERRRLEKLQRQ